MAAGKLVGHALCPECDLDGAEVKEDKNGHLYRWCPDCNAQYFTRGDDRRMRNLRAKMRPLPPAAAVPAAPPAPSPKPIPGEAAPPAEKKRGGFTLESLA